MKGKGRKHRSSLYFMLWASFMLFAVVLVVLLLVGLNSFVSHRRYEEARSSLREAGERIAAEIASGTFGEDDYASIAYELGVNGYLIYADNEVTTLAGPKRNSSDFGAISQQFPEVNVPKFIANNDAEELVYGEMLSVRGRTGYLYLSVSLAPLDSYLVGLRWISLFAGAFSVVLAFVASGLLAATIAKPLTEVTERAKELARGNYSLDLRKDYFCSEIFELSEALESTRKEISKADEVQKELIANISHDFKTPLTMIKAYASMIREISGDDPVKRDAHAKVIIDETDRLSALVGDVLDLSKLRAGILGEKEEFDLSEEVYAIAHRFDYLIETQGYSFESEVEEGILVTADRARIGQVLYNLIGNAVNYTGEDKRVRIKLFRKEGAARFEVIDSGKGIPPEEVDTIWDRYYRSAEAHKRPVGGTGLGLSIVKGILLAHEIPFGVISEVGKGSCFWVEFPPLALQEEKEEE